MIIYTEERQYPPKAYNQAINDIITTEILNKNSYKQTITLNSTGLNYGIGDYTIYSSSFASVMQMTKIIV